MEFSILSQNNLFSLLKSEEVDFDYLSKVFHKYLIDNQRYFKILKNLSASSSFKHISQVSLPGVSQLIIKSLKCENSNDKYILPLLSKLLKEEDINLAQLVSPLGRTYGMELAFFQSLKDEKTHNNYLIKTCEYFKMEFVSAKDIDGDTVLDYLSLYATANIKPFLNYLAKNHPNVFLQEDHNAFNMMSSELEFKTNPNAQMSFHIYKNLKLKETLQRSVKKEGISRPSIIRKI